MLEGLFRMIRGEERKMMLKGERQIDCPNLHWWSPAGDLVVEIRRGGT